MKNAYKTYMDKAETEGWRSASLYNTACIALMDDDLREELHMDLGRTHAWQFLEAYCYRHKARFKEDFIVN